VAGSEKEQLQKENLKLGSEKEELVQEVQRLTDLMRTSVATEDDETYKTMTQEPTSKMEHLKSEIHSLKEENVSFKVRVQSLEEQILGLQKDLENSQDEKSAEIDKIHNVYRQELLDKEDVIRTLQNENDVFREKLARQSTPLGRSDVGDWETRSDGDESITESMMESVVEDVLCQTEAVVVEEEVERREVEERSECVGGEMDIVQEEFIAASHVDVSSSGIVQEEFVAASHVNLSSSNFGPGESGEIDNQNGTKLKQHFPSHSSGPEEDTSNLSISLAAPTNEAQLLQSVEFDIECIQNSSVECEVRSVLNLDTDVSLDSENFLKILRTLQNQKCLLVEKLEQTEAERDRLLQRMQQTSSEDISDDSLNLNDSIDGDNLDKSQSQEVEGFTDVKEDVVCVDTEVTDPKQGDTTIGPDNVKSAAIVDRYSDQERVPNLDPAEEENLAADDVQQTTEDIKVSPCMLSSSGAASSVIVDDLTNSSSVPSVGLSVDNVSVYTKPVVSVETASDDEYENFTTDGETKNLTVLLQDHIALGTQENRTKTSELNVKLKGELSVLVLENETLQKNLELVTGELEAKCCECNDSQSKLKQVSNQFDVFKASFSDMTVKNENLEYDNEELNEKLENLQKELEDVKRDYSNLQDHYDMVGDENHTLKNEHDQLTQKYEAVVSENVSLLQSLSDSEVNVSKVLKESEEIVKKLKHAEVENSQLNQELIQLKMENSHLEAEIDELHKKLSQVNSDCDGLLVEKSEVMENYRKIVNEMKIIQKEKLEGLKNFQDLQQKYLEEKQKKEDLRNGRIAELESFIDELTGQNRILTFNNQNSEAKLAKLEEKADQDRKKLEQEISKKDEEIGKIREEQKSLQSCVKDRDSELHAIRGILQDTESRNCELNKDLDHLKSESQEFKNQVALLEDKLESRDKDVDRVQKELKDLADMMKSLRTENEELRNECADLVEKFAFEQKEKEKAAKESQNYAEILKGKENMLEEMKLKYDTLKGEVCEQKKEMRRVSKVEEELQRKDIEIRDLTEQKEKYEMEYSQKEQEILGICKDFTEKIKTGEFHVKDLQHTVCELESKVENAKSEYEEMKTTKDGEICNLIQKMTNQETENRTLNEKYSSLQKLNSEMERKCKETEQECHSLKIELGREVESRLREKHQQIEQLKGDIGELRESIGSEQAQQEVEETSVLASLGKLETSLSKITADMSVPSDLLESEMMNSSVLEEGHTTEETCGQTAAKEESCKQSNVSSVVENLELKKTVDTLKFKVQKLEKDKNYLKSCLKEAVKGTSKEEENLEAVLEENSHLMEENQALTEELQRLRDGGRINKDENCGSTEITELREKVVSLSSENVRLQKNFSDLQEEVDRGQNQMLQVTSLFQQSVLANEGLRNEIMSLKDELESIAVSRESVDEALLNVEQKISLKERQLYHSNQESREIKEGAVNALSNLENRISQLEDEGRTTNSERGENCDTIHQSGELRKLSEILVSLATANSLNIVLKEETEKVQCNLVEKEKQLEELSQKCQENQDELNVALRSVGLLERELENSKEIASLSEKIQNEQKGHIHQLEEKLKLIADENLEMRNERESIIQEVKVHRDITMEMKDSVERSRQDVCDIRKEQSEFKLKMDEIIVEKDKLSRELAKRVSENKELRSKIAALCDENDLLKQSFEKFEEVKADRDKLISIQEKLLEDLTEMESRYETVHTLMEETKQECNNEMEKLRQQLGSVNRDVGSLKLSIDILQSELQSAQEQKEQLITSLEEKNDLLVFTEKERQKELNDKFNKELQNQRKAGGGSDSVVSQRLDSEQPRESVNLSSSCAGYESEGNKADGELENLAQERKNEVLSESFVVEEVDEAVSADTERCERAEELETASETGLKEHLKDLKEEAEKLREELKEEYEQRIEGMKYEMEEQMEMSLKEKEYELLGKFDMERKELVKQMEHTAGQKIKSVKAEKHKEFVEAMQKVRKDQGKKLKAEVEKHKTRIREKFQKPLQVGTFMIRYLNSYMSLSWSLVY
jgi:chromosome segregation ATPase